MSQNHPDIVDLAPGLAAVEWGHVRFADIPRFQAEARARIAAVLAAQGVATRGATLTVSRPPSGSLIAIAPGVMVDRAIQPSGQVTLETLPPGRAAHLRLEAPYAELPRAWGELMAWMVAETLRPAGLNWEVYGDPAVPVTDLYALLA